MWSQHVLTESLVTCETFKQGQERPTQTSFFFFFFGRPAPSRGSFSQQPGLGKESEEQQFLEQNARDMKAWCAESWAGSYGSLAVRGNLQTFEGQPGAQKMEILFNEEFRDGESQGATWKNLRQGVSQTHCPSIMIISRFTESLSLLLCIPG